MYIVLCNYGIHLYVLFLLN